MTLEPLTSVPWKFPLTAEEKREVATNVVNMLMERIEPLVKADPEPESAEGVRLLALTELCEAYEKRRGAWPAGVERQEPVQEDDMGFPPITTS